MDLRDCLFKYVYEKAPIDKDIVILTADTDFFYLKKFQEGFSDRIYNTGVSEQNTILIAAGLALSGKKVIIYSLIPFITMRCFEQTKNYIDILNSPVLIVGLGPGYCFSYDGSTHHGINDIGVMRNLTNFTIINPNDDISILYSLNSFFTSNKPHYIRLDKGGYPTLSNIKNGCRIIRKTDSNIAIFSSGTIIHQLLEIDKYKEYSIIDIIKLYPVDTNFIKVYIKENYIDKILIIDEHYKIGGLFSIISELNLKIDIVSYSIEKDYIGVGSRNFLINKNICN